MIGIKNFEISYQNHQHKLEDADCRNVLPYLAQENIRANLVLEEALSEIANKNVTIGQLALSWLLAQKPWIIPIFRITKLHRLEENIGSANIILTADELAKIDTTLNAITLMGDRYHEFLAKQIDQ